MQFYRYGKLFWTLFLLAAVAFFVVAPVSAKASIEKKVTKKANCGVLSLASLMAQTGNLKAAADVSRMVPNNVRGYSISQLQGIAASRGFSVAGVSLELDTINPGLLPIMIHIPASFDQPSDGHFCILERVGVDRVSIFDPQKQIRYQMPVDHFTRRWQGIAMICKNRAPVSTKLLSVEITRKIFGGDDEANTPSGTGEFGLQNDQNAPGANPDNKSKCGTPVWSVNMVNMNIVIQDVPLWYDPPIGPQVQIALTYNSKYPLTGNTPFGRKWTLNYGSHLEENVTDGSVLVVMPSGKQDTFTPDGNGGYTKGYKVFNKLEKLGTDDFRLTMPDATVFVYQIPAGSGALTPMLVELRDAWGNALTMGYNASAQLITVTDPVNKITTLTYTDGNVTRVDDPFGRFTEFEYDAQGDLTKITDMGGYWSSLAYDPVGIISEMNNAKGTTRFFVEPADTNDVHGDYPAPGQPMQFHTRISVTDPEGGKSEYYYNGVSGYGWYVSPRHYLDYVDENNNNFASEVPKIIYNYCSTPKGLREEIGTITFQEGTVIGYQYNYFTGLRESEIDYTGNTTEYTYNEMGRITSITPESRFPITFEYNTANKVDLEHVARQNLGTRNITYNSHHQVTQIEDEEGHIDGPVTYDGFGRVDTVTETFDGHSVVTDFNYFAPGVAGEYRLEEVIKDGSVIASYTYDSIGRVRTVTDATGLTLTYDYNNLNHITRITYPDAKFIEYSYSGCCPRSIESVTDRAGRTTYYTYDKMQRLESVHRPGEGITRYQYDANGNLTRLIDANGQETRFEYDDEDRLYRKYDAADKFVEYRYNLDGLLEGQTNARGIETTYEYYPDHLLASVTHSDGTPGITYTYDYYQRLDTVSDALGTHDYGLYDNDWIETINGPWANDTITYLYDNLNRTKTVTPQGGRSRTIVYDDQGRLDDLVIDTSTFNYGYQGASPLVRSLVRPNGSRTTYDYNGLNQLENLTNKDSVQQVISQFEFQYNDEDLIGSETMTQSPAIAGFTENLTIYDHNALNQLMATTDPNQTSTYDDDGNMTGGFTLEGYAFTAAYDANDHMKSIEYNDGTILHRYEFVYGYDGFLGRILRYENTTLEEDLRIVRDGSLAVQERDATNAVVREYVWGLNRSGGIGGLLSMRQGSLNFDYLYDGKGNVSALIDNTQAVVASYRYDTFGRLMAQSGTLDQPFRFSTKRHIADVGLSYYGYRFYSPAVGRWMNRDPLGEAGGINLYGFVQNNPVNFLDPYGLLVLYGGVGGGGGATLPEGDSSGAANYFSGNVGLYMGHNNDGSSSMGWMFSGDAGKIIGASVGYGAMLGAHFGTTQDLAADSTASMGVILGPISIEMTFNGITPSGFNLGLGIKGWGLGFYSTISKTILYETDTNRKESNCN